MDESAFRKTYEAVNPIPCAFEKAILSGNGACSLAERHFIAERESVGCRQAECEERCCALLDHLREQARFALHLTHLAGPLPHGKELKVQAGALIALGRRNEHLVYRDIHTLISEATAGGLESLPLQAIIREIAAFQPRRRR